MLTRLVRNVGGKVKTSFALVGAAATVGTYVQYKAIFPSPDEDDLKKKVLVIPFHRLVLKDQIKQEFGPSSLSTDKDERPIEFEVRDLVDIIHKAAADPNIVALYGIFGHGSTLPSAGWVDLEEVRSALKVFKEAHRLHQTPNVHLDPYKSVVSPTSPKSLYAYADNFTSLGDPGNKDYYLASMFTHIHMQQTGDLSLTGMISSQLFFKDALQKYGVQVHVFKQGDYKNFPNMFTERGYNKPHQEAMKSILKHLQSSVNDDITESRSKTIFSAWLKKNQKHVDNERLWKRIFETGVFPAAMANEAGFVDYLPQRDPLVELLARNKSDKNGEEASSGLNDRDTDLFHFKAEKAVGLMAYKKKIDKLKEAEKKQRALLKALCKYPTMKSALAMVGLVDGPVEVVKDKIALVYVQGAIGDLSARKTVNSLRQIGEDKSTKAVVLRVDSPGGSISACETISQELQALHIPVVVSFGNTAASGGYYIAAKSDRIFASPKSLTGSIGVFGLRLDLTGFAKQFGVTSGTIAIGELSGIINPFNKMSRKMQTTFDNTIDRYYDQFKSVVSEGRRLDDKQVESVAQGRVWTGEQAMKNGLVDELGGGLFRALAYAERKFTSGDAEIVAWPKKRSFFERLRALSEDDDPRRIFALLKQWMTVSERSPAVHTDQNINTIAPFFNALLQRFSAGAQPILSGVYLCADENAAIECLVEQNLHQIDHDEADTYLA